MPSLRILPHLQDTGGFFVAVLEKNDWLPWQLESVLKRQQNSSKTITNTEGIATDKTVTNTDSSAATTSDTTAPTNDSSAVNTDDSAPTNIDGRTDVPKRPDEILGKYVYCIMSICFVQYIILTYV